MIFISKIVDFLKNSGLPKEGQNKKSFLHHYEIIYIKKPVDYLRLWFINATFIVRVNFLENSSPPKEGLNKISFIHHYEIFHTKKSAEPLTMTVY